MHTRLQPMKASNPICQSKRRLRRRECWFFLVMLLITNTVGLTRRQVDSSCERGQCILLRKCSVLLGKLREDQQAALRTIWRLRCGNEGIRTKVCCPPKSPNDQDIQKSFFPSVCGNTPKASQKISFGVNATMGEFPWMAALGYKSNIPNAALQFFGSGTLINARYVLTAAHVVDPGRLGVFSLKIIRLGEWNMATPEDCVESQVGKLCSPPHIDARPQRIILHPMFEADRIKYSNDIALVRIDRTIVFTGFVMPICLPSFGVNTKYLVKNRKLWSAGWGLTESNKESNILLKVHLKLAHRKSCKRAYYNLFGNTQLCVGGTRKSTCRMDSGGPLMVASPRGPPFLQVGIVSFGPLICGTPGVPSAYTSISSYKEWIKESMEPW